MQKSYSPNQKAAAALAVLKGEETVTQISSRTGVHPTQLKNWKRIVEASLPTLFTPSGKGNQAGNLANQIDELHRVIGKREAELEWLKKKSALGPP